jgi:hypothetical protein
LLCLCLCFACLTVTQPVQAVEQEVPQASETNYIYTCLVRSGPSDGYGVIGQMEDGTKVEVIAAPGSYYKIDCYDGVGYVPASQIARQQDGTYYINCDPESKHTGKMEQKTVAQALLLRAAILELTKKQLGSRYVYGGTRPGAFDCSGLTQYVYAQNGYDLKRVCSGQMSDGLIVSREGLQVGDLIFFRSGGYYVGHVGIYVGNGQIIHAGNGGVGYAELDSSWFARNYLCARRIVTVSAQTISSAGSCLTSNAETGLRTAK